MDKKNLKIAFHTLGCKVNQYETEALKERLVSRGYEVAQEDGLADIYIINTCTVTSLADRKSRQYIRRAKKINPACVIAVTGCYAEIKPEEAAAIDGVDIVIGNKNKMEIPDHLERFLTGGALLDGRKPIQGVNEYFEDEPKSA
ncbi:MAG: tRNA (N(6)-L-threonylcarbamoyladenosine(37)-C(2))-methylthiotransferase MtaB, partial [Clostridiales bacterium]|nr:tRNA (N(6)-L-threonylcarbamoyladenosine(37)-C(2))-methylthiotransferase MtaB [Clostridiales bacterium]